MPEGIGYDIPGRGPAGTPPQAQPQPAAQAPAQPQEGQNAQNENQQKWYEQLTNMRMDPTNALMLFQMGSALAAGPQYGQSLQSQLLNSIGSGLQFRGRVEAARRERDAAEAATAREVAQQEGEAQRAEAEQQRRERETDADIAAQEAQTARQQALLPGEQEKLSAEAQYFRRRAVNEGKSGVVAQRTERLANALYNTQRDKFPSLDSAYVTASEMIETNLTRESFIADFLSRQGGLFKRGEALPAAEELADGIFGVQSTESPAPVGGGGANTRPPPDLGALEGNADLWRKVASDPQARAGAEKLYGKEVVDRLVRQHAGKATPAPAREEPAADVGTFSGL